MGIEIRELGVQCLNRYATIPIRFTVESVLRVDDIDGGLGGLLLREQKLDEPYVRDYDEYEQEELSARWVKRFDVANWAFFLAFDGDKPVAGATIACRSPNVIMLDGRNDLALLWDIRVHPERRREGMGTSLFRHAVQWAREKHYRQLKVETQNINVPACKFYAANGCRLGGIRRHVYPDPRCAHETMLLWYLDI